MKALSLITLSFLTLAACDDGSTSNHSDTPDTTSPDTDTDTDVEPEPEPDPVAALDALFVASCERQVACGYPILSTATTVESCLAQQRDASGDVPESLGDGAVVLDAARLATCTAAIEDASCQDLANLRLEIDPACSSYWRGTIAIGEACAGGVANDCVAGAYCDFADETCPGTCTARPEPCVEGACADGTFCNAEAKCAPRAALGEVCDYAVEGAVDERACVDAAHCVEGLCVARLAAGADCTNQYERECPVGQACGDAMQCVAVSQAGGPCNMVSHCGDGLFCDFTSGTCAERNGVGEACNDSFGMCGPGLECQAERCVDPSGLEIPILPLAEVGELCAGKLCPLGASCQCADDDCVYDEKVCTLGPALGEPCEDFLFSDYSPFVCREGLCDIFGSLTCVMPGGPGAACEGTQTLGCGAFICLDGQCATLEETRCEVVEESSSTLR